MNWQSIETAPKDGSLIILCKGEVVRPGFYVSYRRGSDAWCMVEPSADAYPEEWPDHWSTDENGPTHWMPLPIPPQKP